MQGITDSLADRRKHYKHFRGVSLPSDPLNEQEIATLIEGHKPYKSEEEMQRHSLALKSAINQFHCITVSYPSLSKEKAAAHTL